MQSQPRVLPEVVICQTVGTGIAARQDQGGQRQDKQQQGFAQYWRTKYLLLPISELRILENFSIQVQRQNED